MAPDLGMRVTSPVGSLAPSAKFLDLPLSASMTGDFDPLTLMQPTAGFSDFNFDHLFQPNIMTLTPYPSPIIDPLYQSITSESGHGLNVSTTSTITEEMWTQLLEEQTGGSTRYEPSKLGHVTSPSFSQHGSDDTPSWTMTERTLSSDSQSHTPVSANLSLPLPNIFATGAEMGDMSWLKPLEEGEERATDFNWS